MGIRCMSNNPMVIEKELPFIEAIEGDTLSVLKAVKCEIMKGFKLITHPLTSSIRPDISPYKTVILTSSSGRVDVESLDIINKAIEYCKGLLNNRTQSLYWDDISLNDFQFIDLDLIKEFVCPY